MFCFDDQLAGVNHSWTLCTHIYIHIYLYMCMSKYMYCSDLDVIGVARIPNPIYWNPCTAPLDIHQPILEWARCKYTSCNGTDLLNASFGPRLFSTAVIHFLIFVTDYIYSIAIKSVPCGAFLSPTACRCRWQSLPWQASALVRSPQAQHSSPMPWETTASRPLEPADRPSTWFRPSTNPNQSMIEC